MFLMSLVLLNWVSVTSSMYVISNYEPFMTDEFDSGYYPPLNFEDSDQLLTNQKRSAASAKSLPNHEHVCKTVIRTNFQPTHGHEQNGSRVEIQQDQRRSFISTFVECASTERNECYGIDNILFTSECVTMFEFRPAGVRLEGSGADFVEGFIKVPITCQCRLRRKLNRINLEK
uniref:Nerve growth factor-related domain-containing protein n=1 Tax=Acrobeloides nanus TaxID=290746 RepID=A0A914C5K1_9BILA